MTLRREIRMLICPKQGARYTVQVQPLMFSVAATLDTEALEGQCRAAYEDTYGVRAPKTFELTLCCRNPATMQFQVVGCGAFSDSALLIQTKKETPVDIRGYLRK